MPSLLKRQVSLFGQGSRLRRPFGLENFKNFIVKAWKDTYPDEEDVKSKFESRMASKQKQAKEDRELREKYQNLTEEEIAEVGATERSSRKTSPKRGGARSCSLSRKKPSRL